MKRVLFFAVFIALMSGISHAAPFQAVPSRKAVLVMKGEGKKWCPSCGMNLVMFYKTSHYMVLEDGSKVQFCSLHCLAESYQQGKYDGKKVKTIYGVDVTSLKQYPVGTLTYVVGSRVKGTMSKTSKYAFKSKGDAKKFMKKNGGKLATFNMALAEAIKELPMDTKMVSMKRSKMMYPMGEKILNKKCDKNAVESLQYSHLNELKVLIQRKSLCGKLNPKELQAVTLYTDYKKKK